MRGVEQDQLLGEGGVAVPCLVEVTLASSQERENC